MSLLDDLLKNLPSPQNAAPAAGLLDDLLNRTEWGQGIQPQQQGGQYDPNYRPPEYGASKDMPYLPGSRALGMGPGQGEAYYGDAEYKGLETDLQNWWNGKVARVNAPAYSKLPDGTYTEVAPSAVNKLSRGIGEGIGGILDVFGLPAKGVKAYLGAGQALENVADASASFLPDLNKGDAWYNQVLQVVPPYNAYNWLRAMTGSRKLSTDEMIGEFENQLQASRIAYTAWTDPALRSEFMRRYEAGENPIALESELANPWYEMAGEFVLDPLNLVDLIAKGASLAGKVTSVTKRFAQAAPEASKLTDAIRAASQGMGAAQDINIAEETAKVAQKVKSVEEGIKRLDGYGNFAVKPLYTATARRSFISDTVGNVGKVVLGAFRDSPDEAAEVLRAMIKLGSGNADEVAEAAEILGKTQAADVSRVIFSQAGMETSVILRKMMTGADGVVDERKFLDLIKNADPQKIDDVFNQKLGTALADLFPTVDQQLAKNEKLLKESERLRKLGNVEAADNLAAQISPVSEGAKRVNALHNFAQNNLGMKKLHSGMSQVYITLQPGVGVKNVLGGLLHIAADMGPGAAGKAAIESAKTILGTATGKPLEEVVGSYKLIREWMGGQDIAAASRGVSGMFEDVSDPLKIGNLMSNTEKAMSAAIVADSLENTMRKALKASFKELTPEMLQAFGQDGANALMGKVTKYKGDWTKAVQEFRAEKARGYLESWRNAAEWMSPDDYRRLQGGKILGEIEKALQADTLEGANSALDAIVKRYHDIAATGMDDVPPPVLDEYIQEAGGYLSREQLSEFSMKQIAFQNARNSFTDAADKYMREVAQQLANSGDAQGAAQVQSLTSALRGEAGWGEITAQKTANLRGVARTVSDLVKSGDMEQAWRILSNDASYREFKNILKLPSEMPASAQEMQDLVWGKLYEPASNLMWEMHRDKVAENAITLTQQAAALIGQPPESIWGSPVFQTAAKKLQYSDKVKDATYIPGKGLIWDSATQSKKPQDVLRRIADRLGVSTASEKGAQADNYLLNILNQGREGEERYKKLSDVPLDEGQRALQEWAQKHGKKWEAATSIFDRLPIPRADDSDEIFTAGQVAAANLDGVAQQVARVKQQLAQVWGQGKIVPRMSPVEEKALADIARKGAGHVAEARAVGAEIASQARDFALVNYSRKTYLDVAAAYLMPYVFWYSRTYPNWLKRLATSPALVAAYGKYKERLGQAHANLPDWWKYNLSTNDLPGMDSENPLFFNLEATLNPLNGLTGVDFTDTEKVVGDEGSATRMWTSALDSMGKFGPAPHTLLTLGTAYALYAQNEKDAASRWAGRVIPQTATLKAISSYFGKPLEVDPGVLLMSGGIDPYEARRVGRALGEMVQENPDIEAQAIEAARTRSGPVWEEAYRRATQTRAPMQMQSFLFGTGFKGRTAEDMKIDQFYTDYRNLWAQKDNMAPYEFAAAMQAMKKEYPFMDTVLLSKKDGIDRERGYAYAVMSRIPPGQMSEVAAKVGLDERIMDRFYDSKGAIDKWNPVDKEKFMLAMIDIGTMLDVPTDATREEWTRVKGEYGKMNEAAKSMFGNDILDKVQMYYNMDDLRAKDGYTKLHPEVKNYLDWKSQYITNNTLLSVYYNGVDQYGKYFDGKLRAEAEKMFGADIFDQINEYYELLRYGEEKEYKAYLNAHPNIKKYWDLSDKWERMKILRMANFASLLPEGKSVRLQNLEAREELSTGQQDVLEWATQQQPTWNDISWEVPQDLQETISRYLAGGEIPYSQQSRLERLAKRLNMSVNDLLLIAAQGLQ